MAVSCLWLLHSIHINKELTDTLLENGNKMLLALIFMGARSGKMLVFTLYLVSICSYRYLLSVGEVGGMAKRYGISSQFFPCSYIYFLIEVSIIFLTIATEGCHPLPSR